MELYNFLLFSRKTKNIMLQKIISNFRFKSKWLSEFLFFINPYINFKESLDDLYLTL